MSDTTLSRACVGDHELVHVLLVIAAAALLVVPLAAAEVDPSSLVLREADVPAGFRVDREDTGVRSNEREARNKPEVRALLVRWGRVTGYRAAFTRKGSTIESRADLLRNANGAHLLFGWFEHEMRKAGIRGLKRARAGVGAEGWLYWGGAPAVFTLVAWRHDRVFAGVVGVEISKERTLALARVQQRRIVGALR